MLQSGLLWICAGFDVSINKRARNELPPVRIETDAGGEENGYGAGIEVVYLEY